MLIGQTWGMMAPFLAVFYLIWEAIRTGIARAAAGDAAPTPDGKLALFIFSFHGWLLTLGTMAYPAAMLLALAAPALLLVCALNISGGASGKVWYSVLVAAGALTLVLGNSVELAGNIDFWSRSGIRAMAVVFIGLKWGWVVPLGSAAALLLCAPRSDAVQRGLRRNIAIFGILIAVMIFVYPYLIPLLDR